MRHCLISWHAAAGWRSFYCSDWMTEWERLERRNVSSGWVKAHNITRYGCHNQATRRNEGDERKESGFRDEITDFVQTPNEIMLGTEEEATREGSQPASQQAEYGIKLYFISFLRTRLSSSSSATSQQWCQMTSSAEWQQHVFQTTKNRR